MNYIPESTIIKTEELNIIKQLPLPNEINNLIIHHFHKFIEPNDNIHLFWLKLGIETCNLLRWSNYCFRILQNSFGKSNKYANFFEFDNLFCSLQCYLDDMLFEYYTSKIKYINNVLNQDINYKFNIHRYNNEIPLTVIFYDIHTIIDYPIKYNSNKKYKKYIFNEDKKYISEFIKRLDMYINYIEHIIDKIPINEEKKDIMRNYRKNTKFNILKSLKKIKNKYNKINIDIIPVNL